tara:strand:+ start:1566 stop:2345 length:780 start_codon:yes stop_codon:yes gene_type:complete
MLDLTSSVHKTFALLEYFTVQKPEWGVTELSKEIGANKSTVFRFLAQMQAIGILDKDTYTERYRLGLKLFELGNRVDLRSAFIEKTHPVLESVAKDITETVHIGVLKNRKVLYVDKVESPHGLRISSHIGSFNPAHATGLGKVLLAYLPDEVRNETLDFIFNQDELKSYTTSTIIDKTHMIRELSLIRVNQYAIDKEEFEMGLICVAIPIFNQNQQVVASLSASGPASRFKENEIQRYVDILKKGAKGIQEKIGTFKLL